MSHSAATVANATVRHLHTNDDEPTPGADVIVLYGYLSVASAKTRRLSEEPRSTDYIEIGVQDIVDRFPADGDGRPAGRVAIWVRRDADVVSCQKVKAASFDNSVQARHWPRR
jgi:hypothetical protein